MKRVMKNDDIKELLISVGQMGDYLKGKKVAGVKVTRCQKSVTVKGK